MYVNIYQTLPKYVKNMWNIFRLFGGFGGNFQGPSPTFIATSTSCNEQPRCSNDQGHILRTTVCFPITLQSVIPVTLSIQLQSFCSMNCVHYKLHLTAKGRTWLCTPRITLKSICLGFRICEMSVLSKWTCQRFGWGYSCFYYANT